MGVSKETGARAKKNGVSSGETFAWLRLRRCSRGFGLNTKKEVVFVLSLALLRDSPLDTAGGIALHERFNFGASGEVLVALDGMREARGGRCKLHGGFG